MSSLANILESGNSVSQIKPHFNLERLRESSQKIEERWPNIEISKDPEIGTLVSELNKRFHSANWAGCMVNHVCKGFQAVFCLPFRNSSDLDGLRNFFLSELIVTNHSPLLNAALDTYFETFEMDSHHTFELARTLEKVQFKLSPKGQNLLLHFPNLFGPELIVHEIVNKIEKAEQPFRYLRGVGFRSPHGRGLMDYVHLEYINSISDSLNDSKVCNRLMDWLKPKGSKARMEGAVEAIEAIIRPWLNDDPSPKQLSKITRRLIGMYKDPRTMGGFPWIKIDPEIRDVFIRWITGENLRLLFDAITDTNSSHMWEDRRKFYLDLHRQKRIDSVWVAFAPAGKARAKEILKRFGENEILEFGEQIDRGSRKNTSILIAKIGSKILVDGSHSYRVRIFKENDPSAPKLYQPQYNCNSIPHIESRPHLGNWQDWILQRI